jgi:hypothetical protein
LATVASVGTRGGNPSNRFRAVSSGKELEFTAPGLLHEDHSTSDTAEELKTRPSSILSFLRCYDGVSESVIRNWLALPCRGLAAMLDCAREWVADRTERERAELTSPIL